MAPELTQGTFIEPLIDSKLYTKLWVDDGSETLKKLRAQCREKGK